jgi:hypothetical protein
MKNRTFPVSADPQEGHDYMPDWISVPYNIEKIVGEWVYGSFYTGHRRSFRLDGFMQSFTHDEHCISCKKDKNEISHLS